MRTLSTATYNALLAAPEDGIITREMVTIFAQNRTTGDIVAFPFWNDIGTIAANVIDGDNGSIVNRAFVGDGALIECDEIPNTNDLSIRRVTVTFSQIHPTVQDMVRGYDIRLARAEIHRPLFNVETRNLVDTPVCHYIGQVNITPIQTPAPGEEGSISIDIVSDTQEMTRTNPARRSDATLQRRTAGDRFMQYASALAAGVDMPWGEERVVNK